MTPWARATTALHLLALDPGLGGLAVRARVGPARDRLMAQAARALALPQMRLQPTWGPEELDGGIDVAASLGAGTLVQKRGLLDRAPTCFVLPMAERLSPLMRTRLTSMIETGAGHILIALDEGAEEDEALPEALSERMAFHVSLDGIGLADTTESEPVPAKPDVFPELTEACIDECVALAMRLGISSLRAPHLALRAARAHAALAGRDSVDAEDLLVAAELVLAPRATQMPQPEPEPECPPEDSDPSEQATRDALDIPDDLLLAAIETALPPDVLSHSASRSRAATGSGAGARRIGNRRGRPLPARSGGGGAKARIDLFATLRAAVPWQRLRRAQYPDRTGAIVLPEDLRHKRYLDLSDRLLVFAVDASGSSAISRLAEAKGAIELLLAEAYAKRDQVALIAFRGTTAELLLPPTRSLVQTKRRLADLPGGGATPLAAGMKLGFETAQHAARKGMSPVLILLTDGRGNIALDGNASRQQAAEDAQLMARTIAATQTDTIVIDTSVRPDRALAGLADNLQGRYITLPRADAKRLSAAVSASLST